MEIDNFLKKLDIINSSIQPAVDQMNAITNIVKEAYNQVFDFGDLFNNQVYVKPKLFRKLEATLLKLPVTSVIKTMESGKEIETVVNSITKKDEENEFYILSHRDEEDTNSAVQFKTSQEVGMWVKLLVDQDYEQFFADAKGGRIVELQGIVLNKRKCELIINGIIIPIKGVDILKLCQMLFGSKQYLRRKWTMLDIENKKVLANINSIKFPEKALGSKISRLNNRINKIAGLKDFILYKNNSVSINPDYYHLFE